MLADVEAGRAPRPTPVEVDPGRGGPPIPEPRQAREGPQDPSRIIMIVYATDEDIALRASADFAALCPRDQVLASGSDGVFVASDPWTLTLGLGRFRRLRPGAGAGGPADQADDLLRGRTASCSRSRPSRPGAITLRRKGQAAGVGQPPAPRAGWPASSSPSGRSARRSRLASYDLDRRFGIDDRDRRPAAGRPRTTPSSSARPSC